ncbi:sigma-70 family RNA polymerase sigma factor [Patescibacteria group bacterium]|nr:sigma-70 family RNA polymerase sigma factor [Patescibacteria group bacterium]MBU1758896.1 sigma-70 family RNA polymerase sigma factor [Patescibacteria group bacterium]
MALFEHNKTNKIVNCKSFIYATAHNKAVDWIKKKSEEYGDKKMEEHIDAKDIKQKEDINLTYKQELMQKYLDLLQPREKEIVHLYFYEDKAYEEIAELLGTNKNTI